MFQYWFTFDRRAHVTYNSFEIQGNCKRLWNPSHRLSTTQTAQESKTQLYKLFSRRFRGPYSPCSFINTFLFSFLLHFYFSSTRSKLTILLDTEKLNYFPWIDTTFMTSLPLSTLPTLVRDLPLLLSVLTSLFFSSSSGSVLTETISSIVGY